MKDNDEFVKAVITLHYYHRIPMTQAYDFFKKGLMARGRTQFPCIKTIRNYVRRLEAKNPGLHFRDCYNLTYGDSVSTQKQ